MSDLVKEVFELKREIIEARNQVIKSDHQIKNLSLDLKSFERRFDRLERHLRLSGWSAYVLIAFFCSLAIYAFCSVRILNLRAQLQSLSDTQLRETTATRSKHQELTGQINQFEETIRQHSHNSQQVLQIFEYLDHNDEAAALQLVNTLNANALSPLERKLSQRRLNELTLKEAEHLLLIAKQKLTMGQYSEAMAILKKIEMLQHANTNNRMMFHVKILEAVATVYSENYLMAVPMLRTLLDSNNDKMIREDVTMLLGITYAYLQRPEEAKTILARIINNGKKHVSLAKQFMNALEKHLALPKLPPEKQHKFFAMTNS